MSNWVTDDDPPPCLIHYRRRNIFLAGRFIFFFLKFLYLSPLVANTCFIKPSAFSSTKLCRVRRLDWETRLIGITSLQAYLLLVSQKIKVSSTFPDYRETEIAFQ